MIPPAIVIEPGDMRDYHALSSLHYRASAPGVPTAVLRARAGSERVGVLVVSMPTLNAPWRAWAGRRRRNAARLVNAKLRTISRVIVEPRFRSLGIATALVRAYLARPQTERTEAMAAMARAAPIFTAAGMRAIPLPTPRRDARLLARLRELRVEPHRLADLRFVSSRARALGPALRVWAGAHRATRPLQHGAPAPIAIAAARHLFGARVVYVHP